MTVSGKVTCVSVSEREGEREVDDAIRERREGQTEETMLKSQDWEAKTASTQKREENDSSEQPL